MGRIIFTNFKLFDSFNQILKKKKIKINFFLFDYWESVLVFLLTSSFFFVEFRLTFFLNR